jgi:hypothetical protein
MTQTLYANMNKKKKPEVKTKILLLIPLQSKNVGWGVGGKTPVTFSFQSKEILFSIQ